MNRSFRDFTHRIPDPGDGSVDADRAIRDATFMSADVKREVRDLEISIPDADRESPTPMFPVRDVKSGSGHSAPDVSRHEP